MKQNNVIELIDLIDSESAFGNDEGREVYKKLSKHIDKNPMTKIFCISLKGLKRTDASFPRESVVSLIKAFKGEKGFFIRDFESSDLRDNWDYAAKAKEQTIIVQNPKGYDFLGPVLPEGTVELLKFILKKDVVTTSLVAKEFGVSAQNASGKLKKLQSLGLVLASKSIAETGGVEFLFKSISLPVKSA